MISKAQFENTAKDLGCEVAAIRAVSDVESGGAGFLSNGQPLILFEPHIFWKELRKRGINPADHVKGNEDILYPVWGSKPYGPYSSQHPRLERASKINRDAALSSASWGRFQIMGFNHKLCDCDTLQDFINKVYKSEDEHLELFERYIKNTHLDDELREHDWAGFARGYNGPLFSRNRYDQKLAAHYQTYSKAA
jgi:hypothetical protein